MRRFVSGYYVEVFSEWDANKLFTIQIITITTFQIFKRIQHRLGDYQTRRLSVRVGLPGTHPCGTEM